MLVGKEVNSRLCKDVQPVFGGTRRTARIERPWDGYYFDDVLTANNLVFRGSQSWSRSSKRCLRLSLDSSEALDAEATNHRIMSFAGRQSGGDLSVSGGLTITPEI